MDPTTPHLFWSFSNLADDEADVDIFDVIGGDGFWEDGIKASDFVKQLRGLNVSRINLHINSPGGYVSDGLAMYNAIRQHQAHVVANVESQAASIASVIAMAADEVLIAERAEIMIHDAQGYAWGNAATLQAIVDLLEENSENIAGIYAEKTGGETADWRGAMQANSGVGTTYRGQKAVDAGLADGLIVSPKPRNLRQLQTVALTNLLHNGMGQCAVSGCDDMASAEVSLCAGHLAMVVDLPPEGDEEELASPEPAPAEPEAAEPEPAFIGALRRALNQDEGEDFAASFTRLLQEV